MLRTQIGQTMLVELAFAWRYAADWDALGEILHQEGNRILAFQSVS